LLPAGAGSKLGEHYQIPEIQSSALDYGRKHRPKHVEPTWNNKLMYIVHLVGYFRSYYNARRDVSVDNEANVNTALFP